MLNEQKLGFVIVGGQKCGTTSLADQLTQFDEISFCREKEPHYFSKNDNVTENISRYFALYSAKRGQLLGEASTTYSFVDEYPETPQKLFQHNPEMKIIFMLRDPVARIESHFNHRLRNGTISNNPIKSIGEHACFIERSSYYRQLCAYLAYFPATQIQVIFFDDYIKQPYQTLTALGQFLSVKVPQEDRFNLQAKNVSDASLKFAKQPVIKMIFKLVERLPFAYKLSRILPIKIKFSAGLKRLIWCAVEADVTALEQHLNISCERWRKKYGFDASQRIQ